MLSIARFSLLVAFINNTGTTRPPPVRQAVVTNGCCGHLELLKLHAWSLVEYDWVVHLDMDSFVINPMDELWGERRDALRGTCWGSAVFVTGLRRRPSQECSV